MRTAVAETSLSAYHSFSMADLQRKEQDVMSVFLKTPTLTVTREVLARILGWKEASVCGRANSLVEKGVLEEIDGGKTQSGRAAKLLRLPAKQPDLFQ